MHRPSSTALTMVAKLSSARIMSAASLATSVPVMPMATPMAACCRAGASLTPSPVMAVISLRLDSIFTSFCLSCGSVRQKSRFPVFRCSSCCSSGRVKNSAPTKARSVTSSSGPKMLTSRAMAMAVSLESPVMTMTRTPAWWHRLMESATSGRAGSLIPQRPTKVRSLSMLWKFLTSFRRGWLLASLLSVGLKDLSWPRSSPSLRARARQRRGRRARSDTWPITFSRNSGVSFTTLPEGSITLVHLFKSISGAPLTNRRLLPFESLQSTDMDLRSRENSRVASLR
mmetsp:Transcript_7163/g.10745  ORF Transcript_7163/g.10745 Transcript_7163/m.10745 type:complete len:285 (-) Transcript_7163:1209-2063(-)